MSQACYCAKLSPECDLSMKHYLLCIRNISTFVSEGAVLASFVSVHCVALNCTAHYTSVSDGMSVLVLKVESESSVRSRDV